MGFYMKYNNNNVCNKLKEIWQDILSYVDEDEREYFNQNCFLAGGCIYSLLNNKEPHDYDIFCRNRFTLEDFTDKIKNVSYKTKNAISFNNNKYQLVLRDSGEMGNVISRFDFKHNMVGWNPQDANFILFQTEEENVIGNNRLLFNDERPRNVGNCICRIGKFTNRGMTISKRQISKMVKKLLEECDIEEEIAYMQDNLNGGDYY